MAQGLTTNEIRFPSAFGIAGSVLHSLETINIAYAYEDDRFNQDVDKKTGYHTTSIPCMPGVSKRGKLSASPRSLTRPAARSRHCLICDAFGRFVHPSL